MGLTKILNRQPLIDRSPQRVRQIRHGIERVDRLKRDQLGSGEITMAIKFGRPIETRTRLTPVEAEAGLDRASLDLDIRPRRNRRAEWARRMVRETVLTTDDLIWPLF